jgi:succinate dehydrogenase / fumarate reductase cytochrome b subunit
MSENEYLPNDAGVDAPTPGKACGCKRHIQVLEQSAPSCKCKKLRTPRKIHAVCGLLLTGFIVLHLGISVTGFNPFLYQQNVDRLHSIMNYLPGATLIGILLPLLLQCTTGLFLAQREGLRYYTGKCDRGGRVRFFLQRWTALIIMAFITVHFITMHNWGLHLLYRVTHWQWLTRYATCGLFHSGDAFASTVRGFSSLWSSDSAAQSMNAIAMFLLLIGIWATAFHIANGARTGASLWKIFSTPQSGRLWRVACIIFGIALFGVGTLAWYWFTLAPNAHSALAGRL